jgi:hypothetical protein
MTWAVTLLLAGHGSLWRKAKNRISLACKQPILEQLTAKKVDFAKKGLSRTLENI